jgi:hypothetical protein
MRTFRPIVIGMCPGSPDSYAVPHLLWGMIVEVGVILSAQGKIEDTGNGTRDQDGDLY